MNRINFYGINISPETAALLNSPHPKKGENNLNISYPHIRKTIRMAMKEKAYSETISSKRCKIPARLKHFLMQHGHSTESPIWRNVFHDFSMSPMSIIQSPNLGIKTLAFLFAQFHLYAPDDFGKFLASVGDSSLSS
ncbi:hypothetical protein NBRC3280_2884 [Acetobacter pasteurianus NBRC 3280]|uniref:Uncharacterized protein n=1 Tax=Acetobacter pasteurianus NBRC 3278 TaxID=1226660 RepID=A0A401X730_ACEPA|nr:hypothetical protein [Acetobacter pasteurianus]GCD60266.1 hypothetical protein NBRC3277_2841 [Acetobacter pasteurianus NBRC 3277]GCD63469.1 hypothetical protein NBRC3278_2562 [Acetobacter pasteurianus NBRC 3278]GCD70249.1 hypothetical protein NBRC3280_2884 [Acetobacter pasteurianus NBRC 3280]